MYCIKKTRKRLIALLTVLSMCFSLSISTAFAEHTDIASHWAGNVIQRWLDKGLASGYPDGSFRPNNSITRAEFMALVNSAFDFTEEADIDFKDITYEKWYYNIVKIAKAAGYIGGYPDETIRPENSITREEVAIIISKIKNLESNPSYVNNFTDATIISDWSKGYVGAVAEAKYMGGYPDGSFKPSSQITRGEAIVALNNAMGLDESTGSDEPIKELEITYGKPGVYGEINDIEVIEGTVFIKTGEITLESLHIKGDLIISEEVKDGAVNLNNLVIEGKVIIYGGKDGIYINGGEYNNPIVLKTSSENIKVVTGDVEGIRILIAEETGGKRVTLQGDFDSVDVEASNVEINIQEKTRVSQVRIFKNTVNNILILDTNANVDHLILESGTEVKGDGKVKNADIKANNIKFEKEPENMMVAKGVQYPIITSTQTPSSSGSSGGRRTSTPTHQIIEGTVSISAGIADLSKANVQLKKEGVNVGEPVNPAVDGSYKLSSVVTGNDYSISVNLEGYYEFTTSTFDVVQGKNIIDKKIEIARKEPIITTQNLTTISKNTDNITINIDLSSGIDYSQQVINLGHTFAAEADVTNPENWIINTSNTGLRVDSIVRKSDTQVSIKFTGIATTARALTLQARAAAIIGDNVYDSNILTFSVVEEDIITSSNPELNIYYTKNTDVDDDMKAIVVIVHGLAEHLGRYNEITEKLNTEGYGVYRLDHKGHGQTAVENGPEYRGYIDDFNEYHKDIDLIVDIAKSENPDKPVYMLGHSMGGLLTAIYGVTYPDKIEGQILSGAAVGPYYLSFGEDEEAFYDMVGGSRAIVPNNLTSTVCRYPAIATSYYVDPLRLTEYTTKLQWQTFAGGSMYLTPKIPDYTYPVLILHGDDDRIVSSSFSENFYTSIGSDDKTLKIYPNLYHEILNERNEKAEVTQDIIKWLDEKYTESQEIIKVTIVTEVHTTGQKVIAAIVEYKEKIDKEKLSETTFNVFAKHIPPTGSPEKGERTIAKVYTNDTPELSNESKDGNYVIIELDPNDEIALTRPPDRSRRELQYTIIQNESIYSINGREIHHTYAVLNNEEINLVVDDFESRVYTNPQNASMNYRFFQPVKEEGEKYPLVLFLHGLGERGSDNTVQLLANRGAIVWADPKNQKNNPAYVVAPQLSTSNAATLNWTVDNLVKDIILDLIEEYPDIDTERIYITGLSMGGLGTWRLLDQNPDIFAAAVPICPARRARLGSNVEIYEDIIHKPIWTFHAIDDNVCSISTSDNRIDDMIELGASVYITEYEGNLSKEENELAASNALAAAQAQGSNIIYVKYSEDTVDPKHYSWEPAYDTQVMVDWLFDQVLSTSIIGPQHEIDDINLKLEDDISLEDDEADDLLDHEEAKDAEDKATDSTETVLDDMPDEESSSSEVKACPKDEEDIETIESEEEIDDTNLKLEDDISLEDNEAYAILVHEEVKDAEDKAPNSIKTDSDDTTEKL